MKHRRSSLSHSLKRAARDPQRRQFLLFLMALYEVVNAWQPDLDFRRRQFKRRIRIFKKEGRIER